MTVQIIHGDCRSVLPTLPAGSVQCCVTSPPYYGLRSYLPDGHPEKHLEIGLEPTPDEYVAEMVAVFREVKRVLRDDGVCFINIGDSYASSPPGNKTVGVSAKSGLNGVNGASGKYRETLASGHQTKRDTSRLDGIKPKDLLGIPWLLAFALRAPDYLGNIRREADRAWLAALVDGEGCITILETGSSHGSGPSFPPILQVRMCDPECIAHAVAITGHGAMSPEQEPASLAGQRSVYQWRLNGRKAADTIAEFFPFLRIKRKQAIVAWNHQAVRDSYETKRGLKVPADALEKQRVCRDLIQRLNKREAVDLPSWMVEPPLPIGPGWYLRSDVIWAKPNPMPESVRDRPTSAHEHVFLLTKSPRYFYDADAIREAPSAALVAQVNAGYGGKDTKDYAASGAQSASGTKTRIIENARAKIDKQRGHGRRHAGFNEHWDAMSRDEQMALGSNARNVWTIAPQPFKGAHFATMPPDIAERCIKAGSRPGDTVLDPFGGAGTTGLVADRLQRNAILIELNPAYRELAAERVRQDAGFLADIE